MSAAIVRWSKLYKDKPKIVHDKVPQAEEGLERRRMSLPGTSRHYRSARVWAAYRPKAEVDHLCRPPAAAPYEFTLQRRMLADRGARADRAVSAVALDFGFAAASTYRESGL